MCKLDELTQLWWLELPRGKCVSPAWERPNVTKACDVALIKQHSAVRYDQ